MIFDAHQRSSLHAPLPLRSKVFLWYAFACCQKQVKGVSKFVCDSSQRFAKDVVKDTCDAGQRFVKGALRVPRSRSPSALCDRLSRSDLLRFSCLLHWLFSSEYERCNLSVLLFYAWQVLEEFIGFNKVFCTKLFTNINGKAAREILADFKKINVLNYISVLIFVWGFVRRNRFVKNAIRWNVLINRLNFCYLSVSEFYLVVRTILKTI